MKALLDIPEDINKTLNVLKAQYGLKNKVQVISFITKTFEEEHMEPELRPDFVKHILASEHKKTISFKSVAELRKRYG